MSEAIILESIITCPVCGHKKQETMPTDTCQFFYECENCHACLKPKEGDCCVFCSYGNIKCPPVQLSMRCSWAPCLLNCTCQKTAARILLSPGLPDPFPEVFFTIQQVQQIGNEMQRRGASRLLAFFKISFCLSHWVCEMCKTNDVQVFYFGEWLRRTDREETFSSKANNKIFFALDY